MVNGIYYGGGGGGYGSGYSGGSGGTGGGGRGCGNISVTASTNGARNTGGGGGGGDFYSSATGGSGIVILVYTNPLICFKEDTKILTESGYKPVQDLRKGDLVKTLLHGHVPVYAVGKREMYHPACQERIKDQLYTCKKDAYPEVFEDLVLTGCHSILVDKFKEGEKEKTIEVLKDVYGTDYKYRLPACVDERAAVYETPGTYMIYHFALEHDDKHMNYGVYANGLLVETCSKRYITELSNMELI
jgi:hypothetical protein